MKSVMGIGVAAYYKNGAPERVTPRTGGTLGRTPMRRLPRHAGQLSAPYMAGIAIGHAAWSRKPGVLEMGLEGSSPSPVASRA